VVDHPFSLCGNPHDNTHSERERTSAEISVIKGDGAEKKQINQDNACDMHLKKMTTMGSALGMMCTATRPLTFEQDHLYFFNGGIKFVYCS
jgi:hypothetical protein